MFNEHPVYYNFISEVEVGFRDYLSFKSLFKELYKVVLGYAG